MPQDGFTVPARLLGLVGLLKHFDMSQQRVCIYPSDIAILTGKAERYCRELYQEIRRQLQKSEFQLVSYCEFADFIGIPKEVVLKTINNKPLQHEEE